MSNCPHLSKALASAYGPLQVVLFPVLWNVQSCMQPAKARRAIYNKVGGGRFFSTSADAMWAVCPGDHRRNGNSAYWWGRQPKKRQRKTTKQTKPPQKSTRTKDPNDQCGQSFFCTKVSLVKNERLTLPKGLNSRRKRYHIWT